MRSSALVALALASTVSTAGCFDTPRMTRVHFVAEGLATMSAGRFVRSMPGAPSPVIIRVLPLLADAGVATDASLEDSRLRREVYWDGTSDQFEFDVELPPAAYLGFRLEARIGVLCDGGAVEVVLEAGQSQATTVGTSDVGPIEVRLADVASPTCF